MNQTLISLELYSINNINHFYDYEICRQQSPCYLLSPPPRPPRLPKLILNNSSLSLTNLPPRTNFLLIILALFITLFSTCALLFYLNIKFQFYDKLQQRHRRRKKFNSIDQPSTVSSIISTYNTLATDQSTYQSFPQPTFFDHRYISSNHSMHIYEDTKDYYSSYRLAHPITPVCHTYEFTPSKFVCSNCLYETLRQKQQCLCENFFIPIK